MRQRSTRTWAIHRFEPASTFAVATIGAVLLAIVTLFASACSDGPLAVQETSQLAATITAWSCYDPEDPHCLNTPPAGDPDTTAPGIYLGDDFSYAECTTYGTDLDDDGLSDFCEYQLALSFRPLLSTNPYDQALSREPYWAATLVGEGVRVIYMYAYHFDAGNSFAEVCQSAPPQCAMHFGDSEYVVVDIGYDSQTEHWELVTMYPSIHGSYYAYAWYSVEYPNKALWYPRVYVARDKHANYANRSDCNSGGWFASDSCEENDDDVRFLVSPLRNVGSAGHQFIDDVASENPTLFPGTEYFWTDVGGFCGWDEAFSNCADDDYEGILNGWGFGW